MSEKEKTEKSYGIARFSASTSKTDFSVEIETSEEGIQAIDLALSLVRTAEIANEARSRFFKEKNSAQRAIADSEYKKASARFDELEKAFEEKILVLRFRS